MHRSPARRLLASALVVGAVAVAGALVPATAAAASAPLSPTDQRIHDRLGTRSADGRLGPDLAGLVTDLGTGQTVWSSHRAERQLPASNVKLLTAVNALEAFGPDHRFRTTVVAGTTSHRVVLVGGGDPSLSRADLRRLATQTVAAATAAGTDWVRVDVDDSLFPAPRPARGWRSEYLISEVSPVRALVVDQHRRWDTGIDAGRVFSDVLERKGLDVRRSVTRVTAPVGAPTLGEVSGDDVAAVVADMLRTSDNDVAEGLHRLVALQTGFRPTWPGAAAAQVAGLGRLGITLPAGSVYDGSGLSRADRLSPVVLAAVLGAAFDPAHPALASLQQGSLAVAGVSGTLAPDYRRYVTAPTRCAVGLIQAKTGSLRGVVALSGYARGADGRVKVFSFLLNHVPSTLATRRAVDRLATTVTGCW
ncbi:MAG TPA: D-alanyl-D-alanine carboxypeptidase [Actinomycetes bacterium]|nr:D-alanyl-D-alanine carboxypeptidase [Actinomycetes bacterium]